MTEETSSLTELVSGEVKKHYLPADSAATIAVGQVLQYDTTGHNWVNYTSGASAVNYAVCAETKTITADTRVLCITCGYVDKAKLDTTAKADADIEAALASSGIYLKSVQA